MHLIAVLTLMGVILLPLSAAAQELTFVMQIDNAQAQAAGNCLVGSVARGRGTATYSPDPFFPQLSWNITFGTDAPLYENALLQWGEENAAHFQIAPPGQNGPIAINLGTGSPKQGSTFLTTAQRDALLAGDFYVNIRPDLTCSQGEIRGQLVQTDVPALPLWAVGVVTAAIVTGAARLRRR